MRHLLIIFFILITAKGFSQEYTNLQKLDNAKYSAKDSIVRDQINDNLSLYGDVNFQVDQLSLKANKVFFDRKNRYILVSGLKNYTFPYKVQVAPGTRKGILKYQLGDDTVFIE